MIPNSVGWSLGMENKVFETVMARAVAMVGHRGITDQAGVPYIEHLRRVAAAVGDRLAPAGWLHDLLEDTPVTADDLRTMGFSEDTIRVVEVVTRKMGETYEEFIDRVSSSLVDGAVAVKLADIRDNLRDGCPETLRPRYLKALNVLKWGIDGKAESTRGTSESEREDA